MGIVEARDGIELQLMPVLVETSQTLYLSYTAYMQHVRWMPCSTRSHNLTSGEFTSTWDDGGKKYAFSHSASLMMVDSGPTCMLPPTWPPRLVIMADPAAMSMPLARLGTTIGWHSQVRIFADLRRLGRRMVRHSQARHLLDLG
jgi:hypothetical protein